MVDITWLDAWMALGAGALFSITALALAYSHGRVAGFSGIFAGVLFPSEEPDRAWRLALVAGMATAGLLGLWLAPGSWGAVLTNRPEWTLPIAGLLVGFGTRLGCGCVSGHAIIGMARFSRRSMVAGFTFFLFGGLTVALIGGAQ